MESRRINQYANDYAHSKALQLGIMPDAGRAKNGQAAGSPQCRISILSRLENRPWQDRRGFAEGLDPEVQYGKFRDGLGASFLARSFSASATGEPKPRDARPASKPGKISPCHSAKIRSPGGCHSKVSVISRCEWNDRDMPEVANGGMNHDEYRTHMPLCDACRLSVRK
jgi:hypothetical protein